MINILFALLVAMLLTAHLRVPSALMQMVGRAQADFDDHVFSEETCRSNLAGINSRMFHFSSREEIPCFYERIDFGTVETKSQWPKSVCALLSFTDGTSNFFGEEQCNYQ